MKSWFIILLFSVSIFSDAQRSTGLGRGSDYDPTFSSGSSGILFFALLFAIGGIYGLYLAFNKRFGKKEWTYWEFRSKKGNRVRAFKYDDVCISALIFDNGDNETHVLLEDKNKYFDINSISKDSDLVIRWKNGRYIMERK